MNKYAFLLKIIEELNRMGSWSGNTHIQKIAGLTQSITNFRPYVFVMHHYGPYSFELKNDLDTLVSAGLVERTIDDYGYHYKLTEKGSKFLRNSEIDEEIIGVLRGLTTYLGKAPVYVLELISAVDYVLQRYDESQVVTIVEKLKPHFSRDAIKKALEVWIRIRSNIKTM